LQKITNISFILVAALLFTACSNTRHLPKGESLFRGSKVHIKDNIASKREKKLLQNDLTGVVRPRPNSKFLGIRAKLTIYNLAGVPKKKKGLRRWLREKAGEPPVLTSSVRMNMNKELMVNTLQNRGFFYGTVSAEMKTDTNKKKSTAVFDVTTGPQYKILTSMFIKDSSAAISRDVDSIFKTTLLTPGTPYNLDLIKAERERIDRSLKEIGYFYFRPDYILVVVDSSIGDHKVNMYVRLKHGEIPPEANRVYSINDIFIYANYKLRGKRQDTATDSMVVVDNYHVIDKKKTFKPTVFSEAMVFEKGDKYSLDDQNTSLSRLVNMGVFKFVKNRFDPVTDSLLDVFYYLTPYPKKSLRFEVGLLTQNDNRAGTQGSISWRNRNVFKGAEELLFKINGGFEAQYSGAIRRPPIYNFGIESNLSVPRFVVPFIYIGSVSRYLPRSIVKLKYNYEAQSNLLRINSYTASYGYSWKEGPHKEHQLYPINFTYVKTDTLGSKDSLKGIYPNLIFNGIIIGPTYKYTYTSPVGAKHRNSIYFDGLIDLSGNILGLLKKADYKTNPDLLFGSTYAQYVKLQPDFRYYLNLSQYAMLASRIMAGVGIPYGNSSQLPNIKQFWAGGNSDLRGFPSRLLGPGTYNAAGNGKSNYLQTLGDLKLEGNIELRQNIYKFLNMGLFVDAGNIWLYNSNPDLPGGTFTSSFMKELAVDGGFGLRFDFKILILRLDLGIPFRKPWLPEGDRWVFSKIDIGDYDWRRQNMVFNIAIGYPF
jgi:outer membrane protein insertion porin family